MAAPLQERSMNLHDSQDEHQLGQQKYEQESPQIHGTDIHGWKLVLLIVAIMLGGFLVALVCRLAMMPPFKLVLFDLPLCRTKPSSLRPSLRSQIDFNHSAILVGTGPHSE